MQVKAQFKAAFKNVVRDAEFYASDAAALLALGADATQENVSKTGMTFAAGTLIVVGVVIRNLRRSQEKKRGHSDNSIPWFSCWSAGIFTPF